MAHSETWIYQWSLLVSLCYLSPGRSNATSVVWGLSPLLTWLPSLWTTIPVERRPLTYCCICTSVDFLFHSEQHDRNSAVSVQLLWKRQVDCLRSVLHICYVSNTWKSDDTADGQRVKGINTVTKVLCGGVSLKPIQHARNYVHLVRHDFHISFSSRFMQDVAVTI